MFSIVHPDDPTKPEEALKKIRYTYFFITNIENTFDINETLEVTHKISENKTSKYVINSFNRGGIGITNESGLNLYPDGTEYYHGSNLNTDEVFDIYNEDESTYEYFGSI